MSKTLFAVSLALASLAASPEARAAEPLRVGWRAGADVTALKLGLDERHASSNKAVETGELFVERGIGPSLFVSAALGYLKRSGTYAIPVVGGGAAGAPAAGSGDARLSLRTLQIPVLLGWTAGKGRLRVRASAGLDVGIVLSSELESPSSSGTTFRRGLDDGFRNATLGLALGAGGLYELNPRTAIHLDLRYTDGLTNLARSGSALEGFISRPQDVRILAGLSARL